ncbi:MAG TPA: hypothetical protein VK426_10650 [Methanobacterium sp.]|nr:hypothetical protein [Methanobacterium sp.]
MIKINFIKKNLDLILILLIYSLLALFSIRYYVYIGGDEISYINIAHGYAIGDFGDAINGYWSPLYSWLMAPFFLSGFTPLYGTLASKTLSLIIGFFTIISVKLLLNTLKTSETTQRAVLISLIPVVLYFTLMYNTPDLLVVFLLIIYFSIVFKSNYSDKLTYGFLCGFIGALAYLSKSYAFPFFLAHFMLFNLIYYFKDVNSFKKKNILKNLILGLSVFFVISGVWAGIISEKYDKLTISTSGEINHDLIGPEYNLYSMKYIDHPVYRDGLLKPPNKLSNSIWDDMSYLKMKEWGAFDSLSSFNHQISIFWLNIIYAIQIIESFFPIAAILVIAMLIFIWKSKSNKIAKEKLVYLLITMFIYTIGYCFIAIEWRYLWLIFIILIVASFYLVDNLYTSKTISSKIRNVLLIILMISFIIQPISETIIFSNSENYYYDLSNTLKNNYGIHGNIASDSWGDTLTISYYLETKYYGQPKKYYNSNDLQIELENNDIDYYFVGDSNNTVTLSDYKEITNGKINGLMIYKKI